MAHHRWLVFFHFGKNENVNDPELKKLKTLLKNEHIQVRKKYTLPGLWASLFVCLVCLTKGLSILFAQTALVSVDIIGW